MSREKEMVKFLNEFNLNLGFHFSKALKMPLAKPYWIYISLTHRCNFNCQMCGVKKILREYELDLDVLKKALKEVAYIKEEFGIVLNRPHLGLWISEVEENTMELRSARQSYLENKIIN